MSTMNKLIISMIAILIAGSVINFLSQQESPESLAGRTSAQMAFSLTKGAREDCKTKAKSYVNGPLYSPKSVEALGDTDATVTWESKGGAFTKIVCQYNLHTGVTGLIIDDKTVVPAP